jgi:Fe-S-cluster containining protein
MDLKGCTCDKCVNACKSIPGAFAPGEARRLAEAKGMTLHELYSKYLKIDYYIGDPYEADSSDCTEVDMLMPSTEAEDSGVRASWGSRFDKSPCVFLDENDRCSIHEYKPLECATAYPCRGPRTAVSFQDLAKMWTTPEAQYEVEEALGKSKFK